MIVADHEQDWLLVTQNDHAALAAELLASWRSLARLPSRELLLQASRRHDNGWRETDSAPRIDSDGHPQDFLGLPSRERRRVWERGMNRYRHSEPACALLIVEHAIWLHRNPGLDPELEALLATAEDLKRELLAEVPDGNALLAGLYPWLRVADDLSLRACWGRPGTFSVDPAPGGEPLRGRLLLESCPVADSQSHPQKSKKLENPSVAGGNAPRRLLLLPFPLVGATTFPIRCRRIPRRRYENDVELATSLGTARWLDLPLRVERGS